jgi:YidC/Oxa1 family membrane protein insertase
MFKKELEDKGLSKLPVVIDRPPRGDAPVDWVAAKNKYFAQILTPRDGGADAVIHARRTVLPREEADPAFAPKMTPLDEVAASVRIEGQDLAPGEEATRKIEYYVGPMKYAELHRMSLHRVDVMELGMWRPVGKVLLVIMNFIHDRVWPHNYGLAIILLTIIVRIVFWPITHKSTESMKRMAAVQPLVTELRTKYKDNPQKLQQEIMALYKEHKVNPLGGCLPMLIQIPIFIALFMVLRSAIELRFAPFLWIKDLSEPENLFAGVIGFPINLLPLLMAATMYIQQKITPTAGDPAQAKMMRIMMPGMMLFFLYNYASGLALYWTTQNVLMIIQQVMMQRKKK